MIIVVNDADTLIDLLKIDFIDQFFQLDFDFFTTGFIVREIEEPNVENLVEYIDNQKLKVVKFTDNEVIEINEINFKYPYLSISDCSCIHACQETNAILLSGDKKLKKIAEEKGIKSHGIFWIFDNLISQGILGSDFAILKLTELIDVNPRLPREELAKFILKYSKQKSKKGGKNSKK